MAARRGPVQKHVHMRSLKDIQKTYPPLPGGHVPTKEGDGPPEMIILCGADDPLENAPVRARTTTVRFGGVVDGAVVLFCACVDDTRDRGGGGTEEGKVDPSGVSMRPGISIASLTIG